jgi:hypothetical protein
MTKPWCTIVAFDMGYSTSYADPDLKMREHLCFCYHANFNLFIISITLLDNKPPDAGLQKRANFSSLIVCPAGTRYGIHQIVSRFLE